LLRLVCDENPEVRVEATRYLVELARKDVLCREKIEFIGEKLCGGLSRSFDDYIEDEVEDLLEELR